VAGEGKEIQGRKGRRRRRRGRGVIPGFSGDLGSQRLQAPALNSGNHYGAIAVHSLFFFTTDSSYLICVETLYDFCVTGHQPLR